MTRKLVRAAGCSAVALLLGSSTNAQTAIGLNFGAINNWKTQVEGTSTAGVIPTAHWNNLGGLASSSSSLTYSSGAPATGVTVSYNAGATAIRPNNFFDEILAYLSGDVRLMRGYLDVTTSMPSTNLTVSGLSSPLYDVYVYAAGSTAGTVGSYTVAGQTNWLQAEDSFGGFIEGSTSSDPGSVAGANVGNYTVFSGLTANSFTVIAAGAYSLDGVLRAPVNAVQIVIPEIRYWDQNGAAAGAGSAPNGTWSTAGGGWTSSSTGTTATGTWTDGAAAVFSAGTNASQSYNVTVSGTVNTAAILVQEGRPTFNAAPAGGTIHFTDRTPDIIVQGGATATVNVAITNSTTQPTGTGLQKRGEGTLVIGGTTSNSYTGRTVVAEGILQLGASDVLPDNTALVVQSGATFDLNDLTERVGSISGAGTIDIGSGHLTAGDASSTTFSGSLLGGPNGVFEKIGSGTLTLGSNITFGGEFILAGGTLALNGYDLTTGRLHITGNSILDFGSATGSVLSAGSFVIDAGVTLTINNWVDTVDFFYSTLNPGGTMGAPPMNQVTFTSFSNNATHWQSYDRQITPVPEAAAYGLILTGLAGVFAFWRRRRIS